MLTSSVLLSFKFYEKSPSSNFQPLDIPGPDPSVWATPRFLFLSTEDSSSSTPSSNSTSTDTKTKKKQVMALPNMFVAASEKGWIARNNHSPKHGDGGDGGLRNKSQSCNVPIASALLSLRGWACNNIHFFLPILVPVHTYAERSDFGFCLRVWPEQTKLYKYPLGVTPFFAIMKEGAVRAQQRRIQ